MRKIIELGVERMMNIESYAVNFTEEVLETDFMHQLLLGVILLNAQSSHVMKFDTSYDKNLLSFYDGIINKLVHKLNSQESIEFSLGEVYDHIPDTEMFSENCGTFAQIAMVAEWNLVSFCKYGKKESLLLTIEGYFESKSMENQISQHPLSDEVLFKKVSFNLQEVLKKIKPIEFHNFISPNVNISAVSEVLHSATALAQSCIRNHKKQG